MSEHPRAITSLARHGRVMTRVALVVAALAVAWPSEAHACDPLSAYRGIVRPAWGIISVDVPVVVHIMERPDRPCETRDRWTKAKVSILFGPHETNDQTIASVWGDTRLRFVVKQVYLHEYRPPLDLMSGGEVATPSSGPIGTPPWEVAFAKLVHKVHRKGHINVYLWKSLAGSIAGFGRSPRSGLGKATVWLGGKCVDPTEITPANCARVSAHEIGHALGLYHSGPGRCANVQPQYQALCMATTEPCGETSPAERLMRSGEDGRMLCPAEVAASIHMVPQLK